MEFWGVEVKAGEPFNVIPKVGQIIHISQAAMGEGKRGKGNDHILLHVKIDGKKLVLGSLSGENFPQIMFDLVFEKEFELSHDWKNGSVYVCGYLQDNYSDSEDYDSEESDSEEDAPIGIIENGKIKQEGKEAKSAATKAKAGKPESSAKAMVSVVESKEDDEDDESDEDDDEDESEDEDMINASDDIGDSEDEDDSDDSDEDEVTPMKALSGKKRPMESATKTPVAAKKAKSETPQKTDGKKGGASVHSATPHPNKKLGKTPANGNQSKEQTPKSDGKFSCKSCSKTCTSESGLESHTKAKHSGK